MRVLTLCSVFKSGRDSHQGWTTPRREDADSRADNAHVQGSGRGTLGSEDKAAGKKTRVPGVLKAGRLSGRVRSAVMMQLTAGTGED